MDAAIAIYELLGVSAIVLLHFMLTMLTTSL